MNTILFRLIPIGLVLLVFSCKEKNKEQNVQSVTFKVVSPALVDTTYIKEYIAEIHSLQNVEVRARVKGFIEKIHVDEGKPVKKGQILFTLGNKEFSENLLRAKANYKSLLAELKVAEVELKNTRLLADKKIVSSSELDMALARRDAIDAKIDEAKSNISIAELNLSFTHIRAPFDGIINRIPNKAGSLVDEGALLTSISNDSEVFAYFNMSEKEFIDMQTGDGENHGKEVMLQMANNEIFSYKGKVETVENEIDVETGNIAFRARFKNPNYVLKHGASGRILVKEALKNVLVIPQKATFEIQDKTYVYTIDKNNVVHIRNIIPKLRLTHLYVLDGGLNSADNIIFEGIQQVKDGMKIKPEKIELRDIVFQ